jgi:K+-transporting ATPase ATPase C chain
MKIFYIKSIINGLIKSFRLTIAFCLLLGIGYVFILWAFSQIVSPNNGKAEVVYSKVEHKDQQYRIVGAANIGQEFHSNKYFWGRPSNAGSGYDASSSAGSNAGPSNIEYLKEVEQRREKFLKAHPYIKHNDVPAEMVTASGSGLDPDISSQSAYLQIRRVAIARGMSEKNVKQIVDKCAQRPMLGIFGPEKINVLKLNIMLDNKGH